MANGTPFTGDNQVVATQGQAPLVNAVVTVGDIDFTPTADVKFRQDQGDGIYTDYQIVNRYEDDPNLFMGGVTSPGGFQGASVCFVQLAAPTLVWVCDWTACRAGSKPKVPDPTPSDPDWVLLKKSPETPAEMLMPDGVSPLYRISGTYYYGHKDPQAASTFDRMSFPRPPWLQDIDSRTVDDEMLETGLIDGSGGGGAGAGGDFGGVPAELGAIERAED